MGNTGNSEQANPIKHDDRQGQVIGNREANKRRARPALTNHPTTCTTSPLARRTARQVIRSGVIGDDTGTGSDDSTDQPTCTTSPLAGCTAQQAIQSGVIGGDI